MPNNIQQFCFKTQIRLMNMKNKHGNLKRKKKVLLLVFIITPLNYIYL